MGAQENPGSSGTSETSGTSGTREPPEDREMELREHIAELRYRLIRAMTVLSLLSAVIFFKSSELISLFWEGLFREPMDIVTFTPTEWMAARIYFSIASAFFIAYPHIVYELYLFAKPGLYEHERKFVKTFIPFSYLLFLLGTALAYFIVIPKLYSFAVQEYLGAEPMLSVKKTLGNAVRIFISFGLVFQIPVVAAIASRLGMIDPNWLKGKRLLVYAGVFILATNLTMDITGLSQLIVLILVVAMYELSIVISSVTYRKKN